MAFFVNATLPKAISASFLALIPKKANPQEFNEFRPISLIGSLYKILSKMLAGRLKKVLGSVSLDCQNAFFTKQADSGRGGCCK